MYSNNIAVAIASSLFLLARADLTLDSNDVPAPCSWICSSIVKLSNDCDNSASCICDHTGFAVRGIAASCAGCMHVNKYWNIAIDRSGVDTTDIDDILTACGWPRGVWNNDDNATGSSVTVEATTLASAASTSAASSSSDGSSSSSSTATETRSGASSTESAAQVNAGSALAPFGVAGAAAAFAGLMFA